MGYIANVQFAPFYVAAARGYYRDAGLKVEFQYGFEPNLLQLASVGKVDFVNSGGDEVLTAGSKGLRIKYILTQYTRFPIAVFALRSSGIRTVADLRGRTIGVPATYGASWIGLLALLRQAGLSQSSVRIQPIGYTQVQSVANRRVDAAVGYANNEPVHLRSLGYRLTEFDMYRAANIAGAGIATGDRLVTSQSALASAFVRATVHGMRDTLRDPSAAFRIAESAVPEIKAKPEGQRAVLQRSVDFWKPETGHPLGWIDPAVWSRTSRFLYTYGQISTQLQAQRFYTNQFVPTS